MIICDDCGCKIPYSEAHYPIATAQDPYGEGKHNCAECNEMRQKIYQEVKERLSGIFQRAVKRRLERWQRSLIIVTGSEEEELFS